MRMLLLLPGTDVLLVAVLFENTRMPTACGGVVERLVTAGSWQTARRPDSCRTGSMQNYLNVQS
jgi:hypothetical protein